MNSSRTSILAGAATGLLLCLAFCIQANPGVWQGDLLDPDSAMRLVRLDDMLRLHAPLHAVMRDGGPGGTVLHWSHLLDIALALLAAPVAVFVGWHRALGAVAPMVGPLSMAALGAALAWAPAPFVERSWCWLAAALACCSIPVIGYGLPGVVHHHILLAAIAVMTAGCAVRIVLGGGGGIALGAWAALGVWLSPESMPLSLMALCLVWFAWLLQPCPRLARCLAQTGLTLAAIVTAAWLADPPGAGLWALEQDRISIVFVVLAAAAAICGLAAFAGMPRLWLVSVAGLLAAAWIGAFPMVLRGAEGLVPAEDAHAFFGGIAEMQPVSSLAPAVSFLVPAMAAAFVLALLSISRRSPLLLYAAVCAALLVLGGAEHMRFATYPAVFAAAMAPIALTALGRTWWRTAGLAVALLTPLPAMIGPASASAALGKSCGMAGLTALLAPYAGQTVLADVNQTPDLLWRSGILTVGSLYHRNFGGFLRLRAAWRSAAGVTMPPEVVATGARLVLVCPGAKLPGFLEGAPASNLAAALDRGHVPPWLHQAGAASAGGFVLYAAGPVGSP